MYFILALFAARIQYISVRRSSYNGFKTVKGVLNKTIDAPARYRVLIPYLMKFTPDNEVMYETWRFILLWVALVLVAGYWGAFIAVVWLVFVTSAQIYDTWCYTGETIGLSLALIGNPIGAALGIFIHGLSRETVLINGFVYWLATGDMIGGVLLTLLALVVYFGVRWKQGDAPLYCDRFMIKRNWQILKGASPTKDPNIEGIFSGAWLNVILSSLALYGAFLSGRIGWTVPIMLLSTYTMGKINEYRLQIPVAVWAGLAVERLIL